MTHTEPAEGLTRTGQRHDAQQALPRAGRGDRRRRIARGLVLSRADPPPLAPFGHPHVGNFGWTVALSPAIAAGAHVIMRGGLTTYRTVSSRPMLLLSLVGLIIAGLAAGFSAITGKGIDEVLLSGQDQIVTATVLAEKAGAGVEPLIIGVVVSYITVLVPTDRQTSAARVRE